jgi:adenine phosphoribosyltransferase
MPISEIELKELIHTVPDFPREGVEFKDITPLLGNPNAFDAVIQRMSELAIMENPDYIAGIESRGFIFGATLAHSLNLGFVPIRKEGKLPSEVVGESYSLEYGDSTLEMQSNSIHAGAKVLIVDDILATGGTAECAAKLVERLGGQVTSFVFLATLDFLNGRNKIANYRHHHLLTYD